MPDTVDRPPITPTIATASGREVNLVDPQRGQFTIGDIAHGLAMTCRFGGQTERFYSVAEHSVLVYDLTRWRLPDEHDVQVAALFHDGHEAFYGDVPSPLKPELGERYLTLCAAFDAELADEIGIDVGLFSHPAVKWADDFALRLEATELMSGDCWEWARGTARLPDGFGAVTWDAGLPPLEARRLFTMRAEEVLRARP